MISMQTTHFATQLASYINLVNSVKSGDNSEMYEKSVITPTWGNRLRLWSISILVGYKRNLISSSQSLNKLDKENQWCHSFIIFVIEIAKVTLVLACQLLTKFEERNKIHTKFEKLSMVEHSLMPCHLFSCVVFRYSGFIVKHWLSWRSPRLEITKMYVESSTQSNPKCSVENERESSVTFFYKWWKWLL